jgi:protein-disulfide isomerase
MLLHHHHTEPSQLEEAQTCSSCQSGCQGCGKKCHCGALILGGSILLAALLLSAAIFIDTKIILKRLDNNSAAAGAQQAVQAADPGQGQQPAAQAGPVNINLKSDTPFLGNKDAKVTVVEYADYQCPFCEKWYTNVMSELKSKYINSGKIKFVFQDFAFLGADSNTAAEATHCAADQNKFWQYHDYLFTHQGQEGSGWATADHQKEFAKAVGLNTSQFNQCLDSGKYKQQVLDETAAGKTYGVSGTPTVFVNGKILVGAQPASALTALIDAALK